MTTSTKPTTHCGNLARLPQALQPLTADNRWVNWSWTARLDASGNSKWTKPPLQARDPRLMARANDPATWDSYEHALRRWQNGEADGIGYMLAGANIAASDLDHCCEHNPATRKVTIETWARELRAQANDAYCEVTVSGTGMRLIGTASGAKVHRRFKVEAHPEAGIELFRDAERFITVSGIRVGNCSELRPLDAFIDSVLAHYDGRAGTNAGNRRRQHRQPDYDELLRNGAAQGERSEVFQAVIWHLAARGLGVEQIIDELARHPNGIGAKYAGRLQREVSRSYDKWQRQQPPGDAEDAAVQDIAASAFARQHADSLRYVAVWNRWLEWDGARWQTEETLHAYDQAREVLKQHGKVRAAEVAGVIALARADRLLAASSGQWDADPWQLGTPAGTVDLRNGEMRQASPHDYITKITAVAPDADGRCPRWRQFLREITNNDDELIKFLQRLSGYALTGDISEEALFFLYGTGANGKSVFMRTTGGILADYAKTAPMETFTVTRNEQHPTELAGLRGARLVSATETEEGRRWDETKIKMLTGGDKIPARFMRQDFFEYTPQFKLVVSGNHKPKISSVDEAIRRRMNLVPFTVTIAKERRDPKLAEKLRTEWPGILRWMIEGCQQWQQHRLAAPNAVVQATKDYLAAEDTLQIWIEENCTVRRDKSATMAQLWKSWKFWAEQAGEYMGSSKWLSQRLEDRGFKRTRQGGRGFIGLGLQSQLPEPGSRDWHRWREGGRLTRR